MGGLIQFLLFGSCLFSQVSSAPPRWDSLAEDTLRRALDAPWDDDDSLLLKRVYRSCLRLEHGPVGLVERGWETLAQSGRPEDLANLVLWRRRHGLPTGILDPMEHLEVALECALAAWGRSALAEAEALFRQGLLLWPQEDRLSSNLAWLRWKPVTDSDLGGDARSQAWAVLTLRAPGSS